MQMWQYLILDGSEIPRGVYGFQAALTKLGIEGWELVTIIDRPDKALAFFKRPYA